MSKPLLVAALAWTFAVIGAIGVATWLRLSSPDTIRLVIVVAGLAVFGSVIPALQAGRKS